MQSASYFKGRPSLTALFLGVLSFSGLTFAAPVSLNGTALSGRDEEPCYYGDAITLDEYTAYLKQYYPATDHYILYTAFSVDQVTNFQSITSGYYFYADFFSTKVSENYLKQWPKDDKGCFRTEDGEASSKSISTVATSEILAFGGVEWQTKGPNSFFTNYEVPTLHDHINAGTLNKITHMIRDATTPSDVLATEDGNGKITYAEGQTPGTPNASGSYGDCSTTLNPPTCDIPSGDETD